MQRGGDCGGRGNERAYQGRWEARMAIDIRQRVGIVVDVS